MTEFLMEDRIRLPPDFSEKDADKYIEKNKYLLNRKEILSEKFKKYQLYSAKNDLEVKDQISLYHQYIANARLAFNDYITVYKLKGEVIEKIKNTKIDYMPNELPDIFKKPFIIEAAENDVLFGDIDSIIGFYLPITADKKCFTLLFHVIDNKDDSWYSSMQTINKMAVSEKVDFSYMGLNLFVWSPNLEKTNWEFLGKDYERDVLPNVAFCLKCKFLNECHERPDKLSNKYSFCFEGLCDNIMSFLTIFNYMLIAENAPIEIKQKKESFSRTILNKKRKVVNKKEEWLIKYLYINHKNIRYEENKEHNKLEKDGLIQKNIKVRGHLRHQAFGTDFTQRRWIYIESFISSKWIKEGDTKIIISTK
jgi:hypothetical protein